MLLNDISRILPDAVSALTGNRSTDSHPGRIPDSDTVVVLLIDGLGAENVRQAQRWSIDGSWLLENEPVSCTFPSTTPVSLASFGTGKQPGEHGFVGATFLIPELDAFLQPLKWKEDPDPKTVQPLPTLFEIAAAQGCAVTRIGPAAYASSGLTRSALRGGMHLPADSLSELVSQTKSALRVGPPHLVYAYYPTLDKLGHVYGVASVEWRAELVAVLEAISAIRDSLGARQTLVVTADHGMLDIENRIWIEDSPHLMRDVRFITGEPRMRHVFAQPGNASALHRAWSTLTDVADIFTRDEFVASELLGGWEPKFEGRIGDVVAVAREANALASRTVDERVSNLIGNHGGNTEVERRIPYSVMAG